MTLEQVLTNWFLAHPFLRMEALLMVGTLSAYAKKDWDRYQEHKVDDPTLTFNMSVAAWQYLEGIGVAMLPPLMAKVFQILGGV